MINKIEIIDTSEMSKLSLFILDKMCDKKLSASFFEISGKSSKFQRFAKLETYILYYNMLSL